MPLICDIHIIMWSCPGNMPKYYPGLRDILPDLGNILAYYILSSNKGIFV